VTASYPGSIKSFIVYQDQPGPDNVTIDYAYITNEIHDEIIAVENTIGARPFTIPPAQSIGDSISALYHDTAPINHGHSHSDLINLTSDDHVQYVRTDGTRGFSQPVSSPQAWSANQLLRYDQITNAGITAATFLNQLNGWFSALGHQVTGAGGTLPQWLWGAPPRTFGWKVTAGISLGYTDANGNLFVSFAGAFQYMVLSFSFLRLPIPGGSHFGYVYQYMEDQLLVRGISNRGAMVEFIEDIAIDKQAWVGVSWIALGM
jgi:hypothetical protein